MKGYVARLFGLVFFCLLYTAKFTCLAQESDDIKESLPTGKIELKVEDNVKANRPKNREIRLIIKNSTKGILYGNPCALETTRGMGFEYAVQNRNMPGSRSEPKRLWNNFKVKSRLVLRYSPFWKASLNKKLKECGIKSGDRVG